jgi:hypothetical protein
VKFPLIAIPDGSYLANVLDGHIWSGVDFTEDEIRPVFFQVSPFGEAYPVVVGVVFEAIFFECDRTAGVFVAVFAVLRWVCAVAPVSALGVPAVERFSEFFDDSLTRLRIEVGVAFVVLQVCLKLAILGDCPCFAPDALYRPACDVPEFRGDKPERVQVTFDLLLIQYGGNVGASDLNRHR